MDIQYSSTRLSINSFSNRSKKLYYATFNASTTKKDDHAMNRLFKFYNRRTSSKAWVGLPDVFWDGNQDTTENLLDTKLLRLIVFVHISIGVDVHFRSFQKSAILNPSPEELLSSWKKSAILKLHDSRKKVKMA